MSEPERRVEYYPGHTPSTEELRVQVERLKADKAAAEKAAFEAGFRAGENEGGCQEVYFGLEHYWRKFQARKELEGGDG